MVEQQRTEQQEAETPPPWLPLSVSLITLLLPPGGTVLTVWNLRRLRAIDARQARQMTVALIAVYVCGITALVLVSPTGPKGVPRPDPNVTTVLYCGVAFASYIVQRNPFRAWRLAHVGTRTSSWIGALGVAVIYTLVTIVAFLPLYILLSIIFYLGGGTLRV